MKRFPKSNSEVFGSAGLSAVGSTSGEMSSTVACNGGVYPLDALTTGDILVETSPQPLGLCCMLVFA